MSVQLVPQIYGGKQVEGFRDCGAEEDIWALEGIGRRSSPNLVKLLRPVCTMSKMRHRKIC